MGILKISELSGIETDGKIKCFDCMKEAEDFETMIWERIISIDEIQNGEIFYICDFCKKRL